MNSDIMHSFDHDKGKLVERRGRKTTGLRVWAYDSGATERAKTAGNQQRKQADAANRTASAGLANSR